MKNLKLFLRLSAEVRLQSEREKLLLSAIDVERNRAFFASSANILYGVSLPPSRETKPWSKSLFESVDVRGVFGPGDCITALEYLMEKEALIVGTSSGHLVLHVVDEDFTEVVGKIDGGVRSISSSPDGALVAVITGLQQLLVMTQDWDVLYEVSLDSQRFDGENGYQEDGIVPGQHTSSLSWRGDGKYFATLSGPSEPSSSKKLKIWDRDSGELHTSTESFTLSEGCLDWMPSGAKIVVAYNRKAEEKSSSIAFFEKNGLQRSSFSIDEIPESTITAVKWNCSSDLLAAIVCCGGYDAIKIWSFSNNHWYLKQEMRFQRAEEVKFVWDPINPLCLLSWTTNGKIIDYKFFWASAVTETSDAFVVDNSSILVSPLDVSLIPPPMSLFRLKFSCAVQEFAYICKNSKYKLAATVSDGSLYIIELPPKGAWELFEDQEIVIEASNFLFKSATIGHITFLDSHVLVRIACRESCQCESLAAGDANKANIEWSHGYCLEEIEFACSEDSSHESVTSSGWHVKNSKVSSLEKPVIGIVPNPTNGSSVFLQLVGGSILEYNSNFCSKESPTNENKFSCQSGFSASCPWMKSVLVRDTDVLKPLIFGLDESGRLHVGQKTLCSNCSSFSFYCDSAGLPSKTATHLILTTKQDLLFIISMDEILCGNAETQIESCSHSKSHSKNNDFVNIWERGAQLIGVIHGDEAAILLQPARGNLECLYPRKLVVLAIVNALSQLRFRDAILMVRRHRIDFNIIVDCCGLDSFTKLAGNFVSQINNLGHITEFVCAVKNENVLDNLYKFALSFPCLKDSRATITDSIGSANFDSKTNKVSCVLSAVRVALERLQEETPARELCILTTLARSEPPALEEALTRIKVIRDLELSGTNDSRRKSFPSAEESLKHLLWLSNAEAVYDAALGLYDLNLAAIVALNSDKDPKEFLPFLQELEHMQRPIMHYKIDMRLHRYESALKNIASAGEDYFDDCMKLIITNPKLFPVGLQLFAEQDKQRLILDAWGDHLHEEKCFEDAATTYLSCSSFHKALKSYRACGNWRGLLTVAGILQLRRKEIIQLASDLCEELQALGKPAEAATISLEYCCDVAGAVGYFVTARNWQEALRVSYLHEEEDLVVHVRNLATECASTLISEYDEGLEKLQKYLTRYLALRQRRISLAVKLQSEDRPMSDVDEDNVSEASSSFSGMSAYTTGTLRTSAASISSTSTKKGRGARRQRNRGKIRAGSPGEEMALLDHLKGMSYTAGAREELKSLLLTLSMLGEGESAKKLQRAANSYLLTQTAAIKLAEDAASSDKIDDSDHSLDLYLKRLRENPTSDDSAWKISVLPS